jgi:hypothetical protein
MKYENDKQKLIFDKIAFTLPVDEIYRMDLVEKLNDPDIYNLYKRKVYKNKSGRYKNNYQFTICNQKTIEISIYPINKKHNFFRLEYNPTNLKKVGRKEMRTLLKMLIGLEEAKKIFFKATITRLDLTLDLFDMEPNLYIYKPRIKQSQIFRDGPYEKLNNITSQVIGSDKSNIRITMYNKNLEQGNSSNLKNHQRIEIRLRNLKTSMANMKYLGEKLLSYFEKLEFYRSDFLDCNFFSKEFKNNTRKFGLNMALNSLNNNTRRIYRRHLKLYRAYPIELDKLNFEKAHKFALESLLHPDYRHLS